MMNSFSTLLSLAVLFSLYIQTSWAFNCAIPPIYVDIHRRAVHGTDDFIFGSFIGFGAPAQNQSLWPSITRNETAVADTNFCQHSNLTNCANSTGGFFDIGQSSSWVPKQSYTSLDSSSSSPDSVTNGEDTIHLYTHYFETDPAWQTPFSNFPLGVTKSGDARPDTVGLGQSSTLLQKLWETGSISSRSFGFYLGTGFDRAAGVINGSTVFGGYDAGRFQGPVHNYTLAPNAANPFVVHVSSITLNDPSGLQKNVSLITDSGFDAEISTEQYPISLPSDVTRNFITALAAEPSNNFDNSLRVTKPSNASMTITLSDGFSITLAPEVVANVSGISPVAAPSNTTTTDNGPFILGASFLSQVYLLANYDDLTFHLAQAIPEAKFIITRTMCPHVVPSPYVVPKSGFIAAGLIGAVIGGVIGGSALATVAICLCLNWKRKRSQKKVRYFDGTRGGVKVHEFEVEDEFEGAGDKTRTPWRKVGRSARKL